MTDLCGGFGTMPWGVGAWAVGGDGIIEARLTALNAIDVTFSALPLASNPRAADDALNPSNWTMEAITPSDATVRLAQHVERIKAEIALRVFIDGPLDPDATYRLMLSNVVDVSCDNVVVEGLLGARPITEPQRQERRDIANPQLLKDAPVFDPPPLGTYQLTDTGDYAQDGGRPALRKRVFRRLTTTRNGFYHLVGYGFATQEKTVIRPDTLRVLQAEATSQISREPEVVRVRVQATQRQAEPKVVDLVIKIRDNIGDVEPFTVPIVVG